MNKESASSNPRWVVLKFGGTSVASKSRWDKIVELAHARNAEGFRVVLVVSALSGTTNALQEIIKAAATDQASELAEKLAQHHREFCKTLGLQHCPEMEHWLDRLTQLAVDPRGAKGELQWQADILCLGELLSSSLGVHVLHGAGLDAELIDARDWLHTSAIDNQTAWSKTLSANCAALPDPVAQAALGKCAPILITQGFIARAENGDTAILGRGGSDTSAAYFGSLLKAERVEIWTDVAGMFSANPRAVPTARLLRELDYEEAQEIATTGAKVLHPRCIGPVRRARVPLWIKDTNRPELPGTVIGPVAPGTTPTVKAISTRSGITLVAMDSVGMWQQAGFLADLFAQFKHHGLSVDLIGTAETNVTVSLDPSENLLNTDVLEALCADLAKICRVKVITPCAAVTMVGRGMRGLLHKFSPILAEFGQHSVHMISQSSNNLNLTFVVDESVAAPLLPRLHELLVNAEALRLDDDVTFGAAWDVLYSNTASKMRAVPWWVDQQTQLVKLAKQESPRYVYAADQVRAAVNRLQSMQAVDRWFYAMKANSHPALLREIFDQGFGLECVSTAELAAAKAAVPEIKPSQLLFTPNFAPKTEYADALAAGVYVTIDGLHPLKHWPELFAGKDILLRLDLGHGRGHHDKVVTGGDDSKFGLSLSDVKEFMRLAKANATRVVGIHAHLGSGILDVAHFQDTYGELASVAEQFPDCVRLNLGGGLGVPVRPDELPLDIEALGKALAEIKLLYPQYRIWMEPGRYPVAEAGVLLATVTQVKRKNDLLYVGIDTGMNSLIRPALYDAWHEIVNLSRLGERADTLCQIVGPICESGDVLGTNRRMPEPRESDVILIAQAGAYGAVMASRYNLREPAGEAIVDNLPGNACTYSAQKSATVSEPQS